MSATADRLRDAAQIVDSTDTNLDSAPGALDHALALIKIADRDLTLQVQRLRAEIEQREGHWLRFADALTPATRADLFGPAAVQASASPPDELRELNAAISASTVALGSSSNPHPRRSDCPSATTEAEVCVCGHPREAHEHHRPGMNCSLCHCPSYTSAGHS